MYHNHSQVGSGTSSNHPDHTGPLDGGPQVTPREGRRVGRWTLGEELGVGATATVYAASDGRHEAAVKVLRSRLRDNRHVVQRFRREVEILATVDHRAALSVYEKATRSDGEVYYVMERLKGRTLREMWAEFRGRMPAPVVTALMIELLDVLDAYHAMGVLHRDIKPSNIFITNSGQLKLLDFGVARFHGEGEVPAVFTRDGTSIGTPAYMSPEQAMGKLDLMGPTSDVFSVGAMMLALLSGRKLRSTASSSEEAVVMAATQPPESLVYYMPDAPEALVDIVDRALAWVPDERYASAGAMRDELVGVERGASRPEYIDQEQLELVAVAADVALPDDMEEAFEGVVTDDVIRDTVEVFRRIQKALDGTRLYGRQHREARRRMEDCYEAMQKSLIGTVDGVVWRVRPDRIEVGGETVWAPDAPFDLVTYNLFVAGIRHLRFLPGLEPDEFLAFVQLLTMDPERDLPIEDDLATALWDLNLRDVEVQMVTTFRMSDDPDEQARYEHEVQEFRTEVADDLSEASVQLVADLLAAAAVGQGALREVQRENRHNLMLRERGKTGVLTPEFHQQFSAAIEQADSSDKKIAWILAAACNEAARLNDFERLERMLAEFIPRQLATRDIATVTRLAERVISAVEDSDVRQRFLRAFYSGYNVVLVARALMREDLNLDRDLGTRCAQFLQYGSADVFEDVVELVPRVGMPRARILQLYVSANLEGRGDLVAEHVAAGEKELVDFALYVAGATPHAADAAEMIAPLLWSEDAELARGAFEVFESRFPAELEPWLDDVLERDEADLRVRALRIAGEHGFRSVVNRLASAAEASDFTAAPYTERRLVLETLFQVDPERAEGIACELVRGRRGFWQLDKAHDTTRALAAELLGKYGQSQDAVGALHDATKRRSGNPERVRNAANLALDNLRKRTGAR